jgi:hypothetical protein
MTLDPAPRDPLCGHMSDVDDVVVAFHALSSREITARMIEADKLFAKGGDMTYAECVEHWRKQLAIYEAEKARKAEPHAEP